jgi:hypothetical protein
MVALRVAVRRLVSGGGQMPVVAVGEAQRRIFPRLFQVNRARSTTSSAAAANSNTAAAKVRWVTKVHIFVPVVMC